MEKDEAVLVMGEDVGVDGGVFRVTEGLLEKFGSVRVIDTPLAESGIVGTAIGMAVSGLKPVAEIQFEGFSYMTIFFIAFGALIVVMQTILWIWFYILLELCQRWVRFEYAGRRWR